MLWLLLNSILIIWKRKCRPRLIEDHFSLSFNHCGSQWVCFTRGGLQTTANHSGWLVSALSQIH